MAFKVERPVCKSQPNRERPTHKVGPQEIMVDQQEVREAEKDENNNPPGSRAKRSSHWRKAET